MIKICPKCDRPYLESAKNFCPKDGTRLVEKVCKCGQEIVSIHDKFCPYCGVEIGSTGLCP